MKEVLKEWKKFVEEQAEARKKVDARMKLWKEEHPFNFEYNPYFNAYEYHKIFRDSEESQLNQKFGVVDVTLENLLSSLLINKD